MTVDTRREPGRRSCTEWRFVRGTYAGLVVISIQLPRPTSTHSESLIC